MSTLGELVIREQLTDEVRDEIDYMVEYYTPDPDELSDGPDWRLTVPDEFKDVNDYLTIPGDGEAEIELRYTYEGNETETVVTLGTVEFSLLFSLEPASPTSPQRREITIPVIEHTVHIGDDYEEAVAGW